MPEPATGVFTLEDLRSMLRVDDADELTESTVDKEFEYLGYDSLAKYELISQLVRRHGIQISEETMVHLHTPRQAIDHINSLLAAASDNAVRS
ncbi:phosphopantetheine-binding protein [Nonomuraea pusilla]|uniref:Phosphopantetheine attachment site n=1 Tax=Nonomuraea pusilla TaxID=46177 RepID=A0A1H8CC39_9ACTN|nr:phosphopantetheine-binding protein [Nonomuraea pusilla]SEM92586.1 Phosphopantetheine attachment site [Nonomuraea pusilla]